MTRVNVHPSIKAINNSALDGCSQLTAMNGGEGLEENGEHAFRESTLLHDILISPTIKVITDWVYNGCSQLTTVNGGEGLEEIRVGTFYECTSLQEILTLRCQGNKDRDEGNCDDVGILPSACLGGQTATLPMVGQRVESTMAAAEHSGMAAAVIESGGW